MTYEILANSRVLLTAPLTVRNIQDDFLTLNTVGETMKFIHANFSAGRRVEVKWQQAFKALQSAAITDNATQREIATKAVIALLHSEGMLERRLPQ
jgi:hypothetical protein